MGIWVRSVGYDFDSANFRPRVGLLPELASTSPRGEDQSVVVHPMLIARDSRQRVSK